MIFVAFVSLVLALCPTSAFGTNHFFGVNAANSIGNSAVYTCRNQAKWNQLAADAQAVGMKSIRIVGFDCNALDLASSAAAQAGIQVLAGIYIPVCASVRPRISC